MDVARTSQRVGWLVAVLLASAVTPALGIDDDHDGVSDVWQMLYGVYGTNALQDVDGDGEIGLHEGQAGTDPFDRARSSRVNACWTGSQATVTWWGVPRMGYELYTSTDLTTWEPVAAHDLTGVGGTHTIEQGAPAAGRAYYRVKIATDKDTDGDELRDWEEFILGTLHTAADTDRDGMPDGWEFRQQIDLFSDDADGDPDEDGLTNLQEYQGGTDPWLPD